MKMSTLSAVLVSGLFCGTLATAQAEVSYSQISEGEGNDFDQEISLDATLQPNHLITCYARNNRSVTYRSSGTDPVKTMDRAMRNCWRVSARCYPMYCQ